VLKSLGSTVAQTSMRLRGRTSTSGWPRPGGDDAWATPAERRRRRNAALLLIATFLALVAVFSTIFHTVMDYEGRDYSWATSVYWTLTTMTTLGFGDITFTSDLGRIFSIVVLLSGSTFLLVVLPFVFIQFVLIPWMSERERRRAPRTVPATTRGHIVLTAHGPVERALIEHALHADVPYVIIVADVEEAGRLHDEGLSVMVGALDDPTTYHNARVDSAALVVASQNDPTNTNIAFTVREIAPDVDIVATANAPASVDILEIAGATHVLQLGDVLGSQMASRTLGLGSGSHVIGEFAGLQIAEDAVAGTDLVGRTLADAQLRARLGVGIIGVWQRGAFTVATADTTLKDSSILLLAGTREQLAAYDAEYSSSVGHSHAVIIGGGRVGRAIGATLEKAGLSFTIVEQEAERERPDVQYVIGDAADRAVLEKAGIERADAVLITTHDDDVNVYLTRYCRGLRPDTRIISRARLNRNVSTLYRAGADAVLSYAGTGSAAIWNEFRNDETLLIAQGLNVFRTPIPPALAGRSLADAHVYRRTQCNVVAVERDGRILGNPDATAPLPAEGDLVLVGTDEAAARFAETFPYARRRALNWRRTTSLDT
jgi:voltage-gated potassium channel